MPKRNHRFCSVFLFLRKSQISAFFVPLFVPNLIGGFGTVLYVAPLIAVFCNDAIAWTPGQQCGTDYDMSTYYQCDCPIEDRLNTGWIVGPCDSYEQIWCYDTNGICAGDGGEAACGICGCRDSVGDWAPTSNSRIVERTVTKYSHLDNYYVCAATVTTERACNAGYYGDGVRCTQCPSFLINSGGVGILRFGLSNIGARNVSDCYIPAEFELDDTTGNYLYTQDCHYDARI